VSIDHSRIDLVDQVGSFYEEFADTYDDVAEEARWMANDALAGELVAVHAVDSALDLACGTGQTLHVLRRAFPEAELVGLDLSVGMLRIAGERVGDARLVHSDIGSFVVSTSEQFDLITSIGGLEFVSDLPAVLGDLRMLVRPLGHLIFTYEPVIEGWEPQAAREESNLGSSGLPLTTLRWEPTEVDEVFRDWRQVSHRLVMSYVREDLPTIYALVHVARVAGDVRPLESP
jgi:SAM-dependent methyltransferase